MSRSIYYRPPNPQILVYEIKEPLKEALSVLTDPDAGTIRKIAAGKKILGVLNALLKLPEPTVENVGHPNSKRLVEIRDYFFSRLKGTEYIPMTGVIRKVVNLGIIIYDTDFYRQFINVWVEQLRGGPWQPNGYAQPDPHFWEEKP